MKVHFDGVDCSTNVRTGPSMFAKRLACQLTVMGHDLVGRGADADVSLIFIEPSGAPLAPVYVHRLDGLWTKPNEFFTRNVRIKRAYDNADGVIFQSNFDRSFITHHWGEPRRYEAVVKNGISIERDVKITSASLASLKLNFKQIFVCSANWHRQKRLKENIELFLRLKKTLSDSCLIVMGNNPDCMIRDRSIFYTGSVDSSVYMQVYAEADWMLHLAWRDHSPNSVVECLSQNTPVIHSTDGGTCELVGEFGVGVQESSPNDLQLYDYDSPPELQFDAIDWQREMNRVKNARREDISIETCARGYVDLFEKVI